MSARPRAASTPVRRLDGFPAAPRSRDGAGPPALADQRMVPPEMPSLVRKPAEDAVRCVQDLGSSGTTLDS